MPKDSRVEVSPLKIAKRFKICVERNFFTATSRMRWKKFLQRYQQSAVKRISALPQNCGEKKFHHFNRKSLKYAYVELRGISEVSDRWGSRIRSC